MSRDLPPPFANELAVSPTRVEQAVFHKRKNQRNLVTKLELPDDPYLQQKKIAENLFDTEYELYGPAQNHSDWQTTDAYYDKAKSSYDGVMKAFSKPPKVFKLEKVETTAKARTASMERTPEDIENELNTMIDPYSMPAPWSVREDRDGNIFYFNEQTGGRRVNRPDDVWHEKLDKLSKLVPREDYSGWEYKEDEKERRSRLRQQLLFDKKLNVWSR
jgi:hypothetical protein